MLSLFPHKFAKPADAVDLPDEPETWEKLLSDPDVVSDDEGKDQASVLCGARYFPGSLSRDKEQVDAVTCLVLDVDVAGKVPDAERLRDLLSGLRSVVYASPSHTTASPRWRALLPLLSPLPPKKHRSLVAVISKLLDGAINVEQTGDPCRLGFVAVTKHPEDYVWWSELGAYLDWTSLPVEDEVWAAAPLSGLERSPLWFDRASALRTAKRKYAHTGEGVGKGEGRTGILWKTALNAWWSWAAEDEDFVAELLRHVNANFREPEPEEEISRQVHDAYKRTISERRREQVSGEYGWLREPQNVVSRATVLVHARQLKQRRAPEAALLGEALRRLVKGESLSDDVETWRGLVTKCAHELARAFPTESADRIAEFFRPSLAVMRAAGATGVPQESNVRAYVANRLEQAQREREERLVRADARLKREIEFVTAGARGEKYTREEVEGWSENVGLSDKTWILLSRHAYFVFRNGSWVGPYSKDQMEAQAYLELAAASDHVRLRVFDEKTGEPRETNLKGLVKQYGSACSTVIDLNCERSWFDEENQQLILAGPKRRALDPHFHPEVDAWLRVLCGREPARDVRVAQAEASRVVPVSDCDDLDVIHDWLASVTHLDRPCAALYLEGPHSVGKGLFADGVARIWRTGAISFDDAVLANFNSLIAETPLIHVDEDLPEKVKASTLLRKVLAAREHTYKRKNLDDGKVLGCLRLLFTANNLDLFKQGKEMLKRQDVDALNLRFAHVRVRVAALHFLESTGTTHQAFVEKNMIAEHALWLEEHRWSAVDRRGLRFLVAGRNTTVSDTVATNDKMTSDVCAEVCSGLLSTASASNGAKSIRGSSWLRAREGTVFVNIAHLRQQLSLRGTYSERDVARAVDSISSGSPKNIKVDGKVLKMRPLRLQALAAWCDNTNVYDWADIAEAISVLDPDTPGPQGGGSGQTGADGSSSGDDNGVGAGPVVH